MKKIMLFVAAAGLLVATPSCKKGENDPGLSLKSRKARLAGEYTIDSWKSMTTTEDDDGDTVTETYTFEGTTGKQTTTFTSDGTSVTEERNISVTQADFTIDKEGNWSSVLNLTTTYSEEGNEFAGEDRIDYEIVTTSEQSGIWSFLGGQSDDYKNKERVSFDVLMSTETEQETRTTLFLDGSTDTDEDPMFTESQTNSAGEMVMIYALDMLKSDEIVMIRMFDGSESSSVTVGGVTATFTETMMGSLEITLEAK